MAPMMAARTARRPILNNVAFLMAGRASLVILSLISLPVVLQRLGNAAYGVYVLATAFGGLLFLLDLGINPALIMLVSRSWNQHDRASTQKVLGTASTLYLGIGLIGTGVIVPLVPWLVANFFHVPPDLKQQAEIALWLSSVGLGLTMWLSVFSAVPIALERYDFLAARTVVFGLLTTIVVILYALHGGGLVGLAAINALSGVATAGVFYLFSRKMLTGISFRPGFDLPSFRALARFSAFKFAGSLSGAVTFRFDQVAVGGLLGVAALGLYAVPYSVCSRLHALLSELVSPLFPRMSKLEGAEGTLRRLFVEGSRGLAVVAMPLLAIVFVFADQILRYWIGGVHGEEVAQQSTAAMRWLLAAFLIQSLAAIPCILCEAIGKPEINSGFALISGTIHVPLVLLLVPRMGIAGAGLALFLNSAAQTIAFIFVVAHRIVRVSPFDFFTHALVRPVVPTALMCACGWLARPLVHGRFALFTVLTLLGMVYVTLAVVTSVITKGDLVSLLPAERLPMWLPGRSSVVGFLLKG